jgi:DNA-binding CsgD family transcriptional regulator
VTPRERQLACLLADGYSTKEAAAVLNISVKTAETHRASILRKLGARNVADIVKYCIRNQLIDL